MAGTATDRTWSDPGRPVSSLVTAIETVRTLATSRTVFDNAKIVYVMAGVGVVETANGIHHLSAGTSFALGANRWCRVRPLPSVRVWTLYADEAFLRTQMSWFLPRRERVETGTHPEDWDGRPLVLYPGLDLLRRVEPIWRQMSVLSGSTNTPELVAVRTVQLFARAVEHILPTFIEPGYRDRSPSVTQSPIKGRLTESVVNGHVEKALHLLSGSLAAPWTTTELARAVRVSHSHLTRLFVAHTGVAPMRYLSELRLTEFTRLIEESDLAISQAARKVGWGDARVASSWFRKRYRMTPSQYRSTPHPHCGGHAANIVALTAD